jgi:RNA polymerase sigma-70 factor (ECF subfamily)
MNAPDAPSPERLRAFAALAKAAQDELLAHVRSLVHSLHIAENVVQQSFLRAWQHEGFDPARPDARAYLYTTARRLALDWLRSNDSRVSSLDALRARLDVGEPYGVPSSAFRSQAAQTDPLGILIDREDAGRIAAALATLDPEEREILESYYLRKEGKQSVLAARLGISVMAYNNRLNRARIALRRALGLSPRREGPHPPSELRP